MNQAVRLFGEPAEVRDLERYRCSICSLYFEMEQTVAGPRCCPGCGGIYSISQADQAEQLARLALILNTDPTTLLWMLRVFAGPFAGLPRIPA